MDGALEPMGAGPSPTGARLIELLRTPRKAGRLLVAPSRRRGEFDSHAVDAPFLFAGDGRFWMTFIGWDTVGYRTGLASSDDLLTWHKEGLILDRGPAGSPTQYNAALTCILRDNELFGGARLRRVDRQLVGTYHAYPGRGYETGPAVIGLCFGADLRHWHVHPPVLCPDPACGWEAGGLYKSWILEHEGVYYLFYNAKDRHEPWVEQTGVAMSTDLVHWERHPGNPVLTVGPPGAMDDRFASDPCVLRHGDTWVMFYYGLSSDGHARDSAAVSTDLLHWTKLDEVLVDVGPAGSVDSRYAHKPGIIARSRTLYHFYCAVAPAPAPHQGQIEPGEVRGISCACS
jgi:predicted GH43/DUF377 family glycosyl hydrolase